MPFVTPGADRAARAARRRRGAAPGEAFPARYEPAALPALRAGLAREAAVREVLAELAAAPRSRPASASCTGINDPDALARAEAALR